MSTVNGDYMKTIRESISKNIINYRKANGMSQTQLAELLSLERSTISKYESGVNLPDVVTLCAIADIFECTLDDLVGRSI